MCGTDTGLCSFVFDCLDATCLTPYGAAECVEDVSPECWDGVNNDQDGDGLDYCDSDCSCSSGDRLGCSFCTTCEVNMQVGGTSSAIRYWLTTDSGDDSGTCIYNWNDGTGTDSGVCDRSPETHVFTSAGTHIVTVQSGSDTITCPSVVISNSCPSAVHGGGYAGCVATSPNAHVDSSYYCSTDSCFACDSGHVWSNVEGQCVETPCTGVADGCTNALTADEHRIEGYCPSVTEYCVDCASAYGFETACSDCIPNCPAAQVGTRFIGCRSSSLQFTHTVGGACTYSCPDSNYCYECNAGYQWDGSQCVLICQIPVCGDQTKCGDRASCELYDDGAASNNGCWWDGSHCCKDGDVWDSDARLCTDFDPCYGAGTSLCLNSPFSSSWWNFVLGNLNCIDTNDACCPVVEYGGPTYKPVNHIDIAS